MKTKVKYNKCKTCENAGWSMPQCAECNRANGYRWYSSGPPLAQNGRDYLNPEDFEATEERDAHLTEEPRDIRPPNCGTSVQKPLIKENAWELNLENLKAGALGDPEDSETLLHYWKAQEAAGYPGASENVKYFTDIVEKESPKRGLDLPTTKAYIVQKMQDRLKEKINNLEYQAKTPRASIRVKILNEQVSWILKEVVPACIDEVAALMLKEDEE